MYREACLMRRVAFALALACLAIAHGASELEAPYDLGDSNDFGAGLKEKEMEVQAADEDPSLTSFNIDADTQA